MANDFSGDSNCKALWRFESGALVTDSIGGNTLTNTDVAENAVDFKEGSGSADFEEDTPSFFVISDGDLDAGFPLKDGDSNKKISVCFWMQKESDVGGQYTQYAKYNTGAGGLRSFSMAINADEKVFLTIGYNGGASFEQKVHASTLTSGQWYHVGATFQDSDKAFRVQIWDDNASAKLGSDLVDNTTNNINVETAGVDIGCFNSNGTLPHDGEIDEVVVFDDILTEAEIDQIKDGTYGVAANPNQTQSIIMGKLLGFWPMGFLIGAIRNLDMNRREFWNPLNWWRRN